MTEYRLSQSLVPTLYEIKMTTDIPKKQFEVELILTLKENTPTKLLRLHCDHSIQIHSVKSEQSDLTFKQENDYLFVNDPTLKLSINYTGSLDHPNCGFYYINDQLASSQFEATSARKAFPCFDEPTIKSQISLTLIIPKELQAISNMPTESTTENGSQKIVVFQKSPSMCIYLAALAVGKFESLTKSTKRGLPVDFYCLPGKKRFH